jgi:hypothetical protein
MNPTFSIFIAATLLLAPTGAEAARGPAAGNRTPGDLAHAPNQHITTSDQSDRGREPEFWRCARLC